MTVWVSRRGVLISTGRSLIPQVRGEPRRIRETNHVAKSVCAHPTQHPGSTSCYGCCWADGHIDAIDDRAVSLMIVIGLTNQSGAQKTGSGTPQEHNATLFAKCLQDWDAATHLSKQEWSAACHRLLVQRGE
jgi:hypothetical protein